VIEAHGLTKRYGPITAVDQLSFDVRPGVVTGFLGPNGSGKSTTMRLILGLDAADHGTVKVAGRAYHDLPFPLREVGALLETRYAAQLLHGSPAGVGYLLKDRVADVAEFTDAVGRVAAGGTALDREVVSQLLAASRHAGDLDPLTPRERDVLALMAEGRSNAGVAAALVLTLGTVEKHVASIFGKLGLPASETDNRRVLAVLRYLGS
jgi:ABC-type cobalamin/Fe3+-siderophores transport system ATPase subunit